MRAIAAWVEAEPCAHPMARRYRARRRPGRFCCLCSESAANDIARRFRPRLRIAKGIAKNWALYALNAAIFLLPRCEGREGMRFAAAVCGGTRHFPYRPMPDGRMAALPSVFGPAAGRKVRAPRRHGAG